MEYLQKNNPIVFLNQSVNYDVIEQLFKEGFFVVQYPSTYELNKNINQNNENIKNEVEELKPNKQETQFNDDQLVDFESFETYLSMRDFTPESVNQFMRRIKRLLFSCFGNKEYTLRDIKNHLIILEVFEKKRPLLKYCSKTKQYLNDYPCYTILRNHLNDFIKLLNFYEFDTKKYDDIKGFIENMSIIERSGDKPERKQRQINKINFEDIKIQMEKETKPFKKLLLSFIYYFPYFRYDCLCGTRIVDKEPKFKTGNWVNVNKKELVLNQYKTVKTHGPKRFILSDELIEQIKNYKEKTKKNFIYEGSTQALNQYFLRNFEFGAQSLRIKTASLKTNTEAEILETSDKLLHNLSTHLTDYVKKIN